MLQAKAQMEKQCLKSVSSIQFQRIQEHWDVHIHKKLILRD